MISSTEARDRMLVKERLAVGQWVAPWLRHQHQARYDWAARKVAGRIVLDAACANGYGSETLARGGAASVTGLDISFDPLVEARLTAPFSSFGLACASVTSLPFADETFDVFVSLETIEHVQDDAAYVAEARRVVKRDGILVCSTPNRRVLNPGRRLDHRPFNPFHIREYEPDELEKLLRVRFPHVRLFGQSSYGKRYVAGLAAVGARLPMTAVRIHQLRKVAGIPLERRARHQPRPLPFVDGGEPEVLIALCSESREVVERW